MYFKLYENLRPLFTTCSAKHGFCYQWIFKSTFDEYSK